MPIDRYFMLDRPSKQDGWHTPDMTALDPFRPIDPLGEALHLLRMNGAFYCRSELSAPWGLTMPPMPAYVWFHVVTSGHCWLEAGEADARLLGPVTWRSCRTARARPAQRADSARRPGSSTSSASRSASATRSSGTAAAARRRRSSAAPCASTTRPRATSSRSCPAIIHLEAGGGAQAEWMRATLALMAAEARELRPGGEAVITRLGDILVIQAIRSWLETDPAARIGWLGALQDRADRPRRSH